MTETVQTFDGCQTTIGKATDVLAGRRAPKRLFCFLITRSQISLQSPSQAWHR
jgi:hypothetical protein